MRQATVVVAKLRQPCGKRAVTVRQAATRNYGNRAAAVRRQGYKGKANLNLMYNVVIKRFFDLLVGIVALPFFGVITLIIALLIKREDKGPVFYNATRIGRNGVPFTLYKFRTMRVNAPNLKMPDGSTYNAPDDPRVTGIGRRLRGLSLDELPQIINVIKGDMSFIGPRPDLDEEAALYQGDERRKLEVRPGLSGYAQVYGRNAIAWRERLALDLFYVNNQSFLLDVRIFLRTFAVVFSREGVYVENPSLKLAESQAFAAPTATRATTTPTATKTSITTDLPRLEKEAACLPLVSLAIVAKNEEACLARILADVALQNYPHSALELLLVDSNAGSNVEQRCLMDETARSHHDFRRVVVLDNPAGYLPHGCNVALGAYEGDVFLRIDAHARIPADFVSRTIEVLEEGHAVCGGFRPVVLQQHTSWGETLLAAESSAFGASAAGYRRSKQGREVSSIFHGAYRREVLDAVGLYDERLLRTEDNDFSQRISAAGYSIWMDPRIQSQQYLRPTFKALLRQKAANGYWIGRTLLLKPKAVSLMHVVPVLFVLALLAGLLLGLLFGLLFGSLLGSLLGWLPLLVIGGLYVLANLVLSLSAVISSGKPRLSMLALPFIFLAMHVCYGASTLAGIFRGLFLALTKPSVLPKPFEE